MFEALIRWAVSDRYTGHHRPRYTGRHRVTLVDPASPDPWASTRALLATIRPEVWAA